MLLDKDALYLFKKNGSVSTLIKGQWFIDSKYKIATGESGKVYIFERILDTDGITVLEQKIIGEIEDIIIEQYLVKEATFAKEDVSIKVVGEII